MEGPRDTGVGNEVLMRSREMLGVGGRGSGYMGGGGGLRRGNGGSGEMEGSGEALRDSWGCSGGY